MAEEVALLMDEKASTQLEEAAALERLFDGVNQAAFAREHRIPGGASMVNQHLKGRRPISLQAGIAYARGFNVDLAAISPRLAEVAKNLTVPEQDVERLRRELREAVDRRSSFENVISGGKYSGAELDRLNARMQEWRAIEYAVRRRLNEQVDEGDPLSDAVWRLSDAMRDVPRDKRSEAASLLSALALGPDSRDLVETILALLERYRADR